MKLLFICNRNNQCPHPCNEDCLYTSDFFKSKLYNDSIKPVTGVPFIQDQKGDWWQVDFYWKYNLPKKFRTNPEKYMSIDYMRLLDISTYNRIAHDNMKLAIKHKEKNKGPIEIAKGVTIQ